MEERSAVEWTESEIYKVTIAPDTRQLHVRWEIANFCLLK